MKTMQEIIAEKKLARAKNSDNKDMGKMMGSSTGSAMTDFKYFWENLSGDQQAQMIQTMRSGFGEVSNTIRENKHSTSINFPGIDKITTDTLKVVGLEEALTSFVDEMQNLQKSMGILVKTIQNITITVPETKVTVDMPTMPEIKMPEIKLPTINVPAPKVTVKMPETKKEKTVVEEYPEYDKEGNLKSYTETYSDGTKRKANYLITGKVKYD